MRSPVLLAILVSLVVAAPAHAGIGNVIPYDDANSEPKDFFRADEALYAIGTADLGGGDICVVPPDTELLPDNSLDCDDVAEEWASPNQVSAIGTYIVPIQGPYLRIGTWRLLGDGECTTFGSDDNCVDSSQDAISETFSVYACAPDCDPSIAQANLDLWKGWAGGPLGQGTTAACIGITVYNDNPFGRAGRRAGPSFVVGKRAGDWIDDESTDKTGVVTATIGGESGGRRFSLVEFAVSQMIDSLGISTSYNEAAMAMAADILCKQKQMLADIAADPPSDDYETVAAPQFETWPTSHDEIGDELIDAEEDFHAWGRAQLAAVERYQGAVLDDSTEFKHLQAGAITRAGDEMIDAVRRMSEAMTDYRNALAAVPEGSATVLTPADKANLQAIYERIRDTGFTAGEVADLQALGLSAAQIDFLKTTFDRPIEAAPTDTSIVAMLDSVIAALNDSEAPIQAISNDANNTAAGTNAAPVADFNFAPTSGPAPLEVEFTDASTDADDEPLTVTWDFGDGETGSGLSPSHTYNADGDYIVTQSVTDGFVTVTAQKTVNVGADNIDPIAAFETTQDALTVNVDAAASSDADGGNIDTYTWNWGDGSADDTGQPQSHTYAAAGTYTITLTVTDGEGGSDTATAEVTVDAANVPPTAAFTHTETDRTTNVDAADSDDPDGTIETYSWDWGDNSADDTGETQSHTYAAAGTYTVTLTVTDDDDATDEATAEVTVSDPNQSPVAAFTHTETGLTTEVDATTSDDPDGVVSAWSWNWGDGSAEDAGQTQSHPYAAAGTYTVTLTVTDDDGATDTETHEVTVEAAPSPPDAVDDAIDAEGAQSLDVLANDLDPAGQDITVTSSSDPAHGTAECSELGACLYTADDGYTGADSFTYTISDPGGLTDTATVTVNVTAPPVSNTLVAQDDELVTRAPDAGTVDVLANDSSPSTPLEVTTLTPDAQDGDVACEAGGECTYTPDAGFSGNDGFTYTVRDAAQAEATATVRVTVAPAPGYAEAVHGSPAEVVQGEGADWDVGVSATPEGISDTALKALDAPETTAALEGPHQLDTASVKTAKGWTADPPANGNTSVEARAGDGAMLGEAVNDIIPKPLPALSQGTGGDGHVPILVGSKVFAFFHHQFPTQVTCVDRATASLCPGYPKTVNAGTTDINGPGVVVGTRIYTHLLTAPGYSQSASISLYCWDTARNQPCARIIVARLPQTEQPNASHPVLVDGKIYLVADGGRLYCVDPETEDLCAVPSAPTGLDASTVGVYDVMAHGTRIYMSRSNNAVACYDTVTGSTCPGWTTPKDFAGRWNLVNRYSTGGVADGLCVVGGGTGTCVTDADPATRTDITWWATDDYYSATQEAETGTRTLVAHHGRSGLGCWDWTTMAYCTGGNYGADGWVDAASHAYGTTFDGTCAVALGDPGQIYTVDPAGSSPCTSLSTGTERRTIDLRDQRCDATVGAAAWKQVKLVDSASGEFAELEVTVRDKETDEVLATGDISAAPLDLSGIDAEEHPTVTIDARGTSAVGDPAWSDAVFPRIEVVWDADPKQLCFETTTVPDCAAPLDPLRVTAKLTGASGTEEKQLTLLRAPCPPALAPMTDATVAEGAALSAQATATDPNGGALTYSLVEPARARRAPTGMTIDPATGQLSWTPTEEQGPGTFTVGVRVTDPSLRTDEKTFTVTVTEVNRAPEMAAIGNRTVTAGDRVTVPAPATDPDRPANRLTYSLPAAPAGATIDAATGTVSWTAVEGTNAFTVRATDDGAPALSAERSFSVTAAPGGGSANDIVLGCTDRKVVLEDVVPKGRRVQLLGFADKSFAGQEVRIVFTATRKVVARATIAADGSFSTTAPLPAKKLRNSNKARYQARIGSERSLALKLARRMRITAISASYGGSVVIRGKVTPPLAKKKKDRRILLQQVVDCEQARTVARFQPRKNGTFIVNVQAPANARAAVYRLRTKVKRNKRSKRIVNTFTLPRSVNFS